MTTDTPDARALVERLLWLEAQYRSAGRFLAEDFKEASATITALLAENERLRGVLTRIVESADPYTTGDGHARCAEIARDGLKGADQ